jgi:hypothetical protein
MQTVAYLLATACSSNSLTVGVCAMAHLECQGSTAQLLRCEERCSALLLLLLRCDTAAVTSQSALCLCTALTVTAAAASLHSFSSRRDFTARPLHTVCCLLNCRIAMLCTAVPRLQVSLLLLVQLLSAVPLLLLLLLLLLRLLQLLPHTHDHT